MEEGEISNDDLYSALHQRLVATGEWARLSTLLKRMLDDSGWEGEMNSHALGMSTPFIPSLSPISPSLSDPPSAVETVTSSCHGE
ncbi:SAGA histone acetylase and TREX-2 complexes component [Thecaphora frezii]